MPVLTDEEAFVEICRVVGIRHIRELISTSDEEIGARCAPHAELASLLVALKRETQRQAGKRVKCDESESEGGERGKW
jgi:hypothetical protein